MNKLIAFAKQNGYEVVDLYDDDSRLPARLTAFEAEMDKKPIDILIAGGHGNKNLLTAQDLEVIIKQGVNDDVCKDTKTYLFSCLTGAQLGPALVEKGCPQYFGYTCVSEDTEILTSNGWKNIDTISNDDEPLTLNSTGHLEFKKINAITKDNYDGEMYHISNKRTDQLVTPNHRVLYFPEFSENIKVCEALELYKNHKSNNLRVPINGLYDVPDYNISDEEIFLWAWILSEGTIRHNSNSKSGKGHVISPYDKRLKRNGQDRIVIGQSLNHPDEIMRIRKILKMNNIVWNEKDYLSPLGSTPVRRFIFYKNGYSKEMPEWFRKFSRRQAQLFLNEYRLGDGHRRNYIITTAKAWDVEIISCLAVLAGWLFNVVWVPNTSNSRGKGCYQVSILTKFKNKSWVSIKPVKYNGRVWCVNTDNNTIICRRNGKASITGNSEFTFIYHPDYQRTPLEDPYARAFFDAGLATGYALLLGKSPLEIYNETINRYQYWWDYWIKQDDPMADDILQWLNWDKRHFIGLVPGQEAMVEPAVATLNLPAFVLPLGAAGLLLFLLMKT